MSAINLHRRAAESLAARIIDVLSLEEDDPETAWEDLRESFDLCGIDGLIERALLDVTRRGDEQ
jgi:hypothetical protein